MQDKLPAGGSSRRKHTPYKPYWDDTLTRLWHIANDKEKEFTRFKGHRRIKSTLRIAYANARNAFDKYLRQRQRAYRRGLLIDIEDCSTSDPRQFWKHINKLGPKRKTDIPWEVYDEHGNVCHDKDTVLKTWEREYYKLLNDKSGNFDESFYHDILESKTHFERNMLDPLYAENVFLNKPLDINEISKAVSKAKTGKSAGIDMIPNEVLKNDCVIRCLHVLFQLCFDSGLMPSAWTQAIVCPIPKSRSNDPRLPLSYRGLSLLSCIYKIYSSILNSRLLSFLEDNNILFDEQNGFRSKRSCVDHIFSINSIIQNKINERGNVFACFVDFRKAFDLLPRDLLLFRLLEYGVDGKMYNAIKCIYRKSSCAVRINDKMTDWFSAEQGVRQGDNLSPTLFSAFVNSLIGELKSGGVGVKLGDDCISVLAYADDLVLLSENEPDLQNLLNVLNSWCHRWQLCINLDKTKVMHFRKKTCNKTIFDFTINGVPLEVVSEYKYLGILLNEHLDFEKTAELLSSAAGRALGGVINKVKWNKDLGYQTYSKLIDSCVIPILLYGSGVWGLKKFKCCEDVILRACRYYIGVHRLAPIPGIQGDMGWLDCKSRWTQEAVRLYNRFIAMDNSRINKKIFLYDRQKSANNWSKKFHKITDDLNLTVFCNNQSIIPLDLVKSRLWDNFKVDWEHHCATKPKLRTYVMHKKDVNVASHICSNLPKYERSLISQLRLGILPIRIETGRYSNLPEQQRICLLCDSNQVENELHFVFQCHLYDIERNQFEHALNVSFSELSDIDKFTTIFQHPFILGRYLRQAIRKRRDKLYR